MTNDVIYCISNALDKEFGYEIHMEEVEQDLVEPCFFVTLLDSETKHVVAKRYEKRNQICIQYFPESGQIHRECNDVAERLTACLEYIEGEDRNFIHGTEMHYQVTDGILNFFVNYNFHVIKTEAQQERMQEISIKNQMKER